MKRVKMPDTVYAYGVEQPPLTDAQQIVMAVQKITWEQYSAEQLQQRAAQYVEQGNFPAVALVVGQIGTLLAQYESARSAALRLIHETLGEEDEV